jgi:ribosomal RNA assembly protein
MTEYSHDLKIPKDRVGVLIGPKGETKKELEQLSKSHLDIDSETGEVIVTGTDPILLFSMRDVIKSIGRGFNPDIAKLLLKQDYSLDLIDIYDFAKTKNDVLRLKGRVIGSEGKSRRTIENLCEVYISVYGKTLAVIGESSNVSLARKAIESLLSGSPHSSVYKFLEKSRRKMRAIDF